MTLVELFKQGYDIGSSIPREARARATARKQYGDLAADNPDLFIALQQDARAGKQLELQQAQDTRAQGTYDFNMQGAQQDKRKEAVLGLVNGLRAARDAGEDVGKAFDRFASSGLLDQLGVAAGDRDQMRQAVVDNPALLDQYYSSLTDPATAAKLQLAGAKTAAAEADKAEGARQLTDLTQEIRQNYDVLNEKGAIPSTGNSIVGGAKRWLASSWLGRLTGSIAGTEAESRRQSIEGARSLLIQAIKDATGMSAQQLNSNFELQNMLKAATDPSQSYEANIAALDRIQKLYGVDLNSVADKADGTAPADKPADQQTYGDGSGPKLYVGFTDPDLGTYIGGDPTKAESWRK